MNFSGVDIKISLEGKGAGYGKYIIILFTCSFQLFMILKILSKTTIKQYNFVEIFIVVGG